jgi:hypothetical protein
MEEQTMMTFYSAVGCYRIRKENGRNVPYIQKLGKLYPLSIPEFVIWSTLLWEVLTYNELEKFYQAQIRALAVKTPPLDELLELLIRRKLVVKGVGYTGRDALYNMLSDAFVVPFRQGGSKRLWSLLKLTIQRKVSFSQACVQLMQKRRCDSERRVQALVNQTPLSTSELIRCFEKGITDVSSTQKVLDQIYPDSTQAEIAAEEVLASCANDVLQAVSNLYLERQIIFEIP